MPNAGDANTLAKEVGGLRISNVRSLSPSAGDGAPPWKDPTAKCVICFLDIAKYKLKEHIYVTHFSFYRPYKCKDCDYKCGDSDIYLQDHLMTTGHQNGCDVISTTLPYLERIIDMIYVHCRKLALDDHENVRIHLAEISAAAKNYGSSNFNFSTARNGDTTIRNSNLTASPVRNAASPARTSRTSLNTSATLTVSDANKSPTPDRRRSTYTSRKASEDAAAMAAFAEPAKRKAASPTKQKTTKRRKATSEATNRKRASYYLCQTCQTKVHKDEREEHVRAKHNKNDDSDVGEDSPAWNECFKDAEEEDVTDEEGTESDSDDSYRPGLAASRSPSPKAKTSRRGKKPVVKPPTEKTSPPKRTTRDVDLESTSTVTSADERVPSTPTSIGGSEPCAVGSNNLSTQSCDDNASNRSTPQQQQCAASTISRANITCDFCQIVCTNQEVLKAHCLERHVGGFCPFYCSACNVKDASARKMGDHCRSVHKNPKCMKKSVPTEEEKKHLVEVRDSLVFKGIAFDLAAYGVQS